MIKNVIKIKGIEMEKILHFTFLSIIILLFASCSYNKNIKEDVLIKETTKSLIQGNVLKTSNSNKTILYIKEIIK